MAIITRSAKGAPLSHAEGDSNFLQLDEHPSGVKINNNKGVGIKLDAAAPKFGYYDLLGVIQ